MSVVPVRYAPVPTNVPLPTAPRLETVTPEVVEAAREALLIGT